jgi:hypothetical protein
MRIATNGGVPIARSPIRIVTEQPQLPVESPITAPTVAPVSNVIRVFPMPSPLPPTPLPVQPVPAPAPPAVAAPQPTGATNAGTPVPVGFPTNQFFVSNDGSVWEFSQAQGTWINTGTPYNVGPSAVSPTPAAVPAGAVSPAASTQPVNVTVAPAATESAYQSVLDWLSQSTLISSVPNWILVLGAGLLALKISREGRR